MQLGSCMTVAVVWAGSYSSDSPLSLGTSICHRFGPKKQVIIIIIKSYHLFLGYEINLESALFFNEVE